MTDKAFIDEDGRIDLEELRDAAEHNGKSATTVYIGGPGWDVLLPFLDLADAARALTFTFMPRSISGAPKEWRLAMDRLLELTERFTNFGDVPEREKAHQ